MVADVVEGDTIALRLATVTGRNARRLRTDAEVTLDQVSIAARKHGLKWSESRVADFESGRVAPNLATLIAVCLALADAGCPDATLPELLHSGPPIQINESLLLSSDQVANLLSGHPAGEPITKLPAPPPEVVNVNAGLEFFDFQAFIAMVMEAGATEERTRKTLGISSTELAKWSAALWKRTFSQERDRRAGEGANRQKRGQVTRQMRKELQAAIEAATHGDDK
jgi:hypothetical protein